MKNNKFLSDLNCHSTPHTSYRVFSFILKARTQKKKGGKKFLLLFLRVFFFMPACLHACLATKMTDWLKEWKRKAKKKANDFISPPLLYLHRQYYEYFMRILKFHKIKIKLSMGKEEVGREWGEKMNFILNQSLNFHLMIIDFTNNEKKNIKKRKRIWQQISLWRHHINSMTFVVVTMMGFLLLSIPQ